MRTTFLLLALVLLLPGTPSAQTPLDSLAGKRVHVYLPAPDWENLTVQNWNIPMQRVAKNWYSATLAGSAFSSSQGFYFATDGQRMFLTKAGYAPQETAVTRFQVSDFQGRQDLWIIVDPSGPLGAPPVLLLEPPRIIHVLNPWPASGPRLEFPAGAAKGMIASDDHCGWFTAFLLKPAELALRFKELYGDGAYGDGGPGSEADFDLAPVFASKGVPGPLGTQLWLDTETKTWSGAYPDKAGSCRYLMAATVRDFASGHPDFDFGAISGSHHVPGMIENTLSAERKPVRTAKTYTPALFNAFDTWWRTDTANADTALRSYETCADIPMSKSDDGLWEFDGYATPDRGFYPIDGFANPNNKKTTPTCFNLPGTSYWVTALPPHNMNFCLEAHAKFTYRRGQKIEFRGDDDAWIFIDGKLAVDLGGVHTPMEDTVDLDQLGLVPGNEYAFDFFYCERQPCASSLQIKTPIYFQQQPSLEAVPDGFATGGYRIVKRRGGPGSCAGTDSASEVAPAGLVYLLTNAAGSTLDTLEEGTHKGGIRIEGVRVAVDASRVTGLPDGAYAVVVHEAANRLIRVHIPFRTGVPVSVAKPKPAAVRPTLGRRVRDILGRMFDPAPQSIP